MLSSELKIYAFSSNAGFSRKPYEVLARGELAVEIFNQALREGKACISRMQLTVIGDVGVGKTSLVRSLSGEDFKEERKETHGIDTSMVEMTELDESWHAAATLLSYWVLIKRRDRSPRQSLASDPDLKAIVLSAEN